MKKKIFIPRYLGNRYRLPMIQLADPNAVDNNIPAAVAFEDQRCVRLEAEIPGYEKMYLHREYFEWLLYTKYITQNI